MPSISYGSGAYKRDEGNFPPLQCINLFIEKAKTSENQVALLSREGLAETSTVGTGPIHGMFSKPDVFNGDLFTISGNMLYRAGVSLGAITGHGPIKWAASDNELVLTRGGPAYSYNGTDLQEVAFPDGPAVRSVAFLGSLFVFGRDNTGEFYWSDPDDGRTIDALNFATAERSGDNLYDIAVLGDNLWLFGKDSIEPWAQTGDADLPFQRIEQVAPTKGIVQTGAIAEADNSIVFAGVDGVIYRIADVPLRISDHWLEAKVAASSAVGLFPFKYQGHEFVVIRLDGETYAIDMATQEICEFQTAQANWIANCATMIDGVAYFGHATSNQILKFGGWTDIDSALERRFTAAAQLDVATVVSRVSLWVNAGSSDDLTLDPQIEMRCSDDAGRTWSDPQSESLGATGDYRHVPEFRALGMFDAPGAMFEFRVTDPVSFRLSDVKVNDPAARRG